MKNYSIASLLFAALLLSAWGCKKCEKGECDAEPTAVCAENAEATQPADNVENTESTEQPAEPTA